MTEQEQRIAIAEWMGWKRGTVTQEQSAYFGTPLTTEAWFPPDKRDWNELECPDYTHDLNAMAEAEEHLKGEQQGGNERLRFYWMLAQVVAPMLTADQIGFLFIHATAAQRAEALLRTLNLWKL